MLRSAPDASALPHRDRLDWCAQMPAPADPLQKSVVVWWKTHNPIGPLINLGAIHDHLLLLPDSGEKEGALVDWLMSCVDRGANICLDLAKEPQHSDFFTSSIDTVSKSIQAIVSADPLSSLSREVYRRYLEWFVGANPLNTLSQKINLVPGSAEAQSLGLSTRVALISMQVGLNVIHREMKKAVLAYVDLYRTEPSVSFPVTLGRPTSIGPGVLLSFLDQVGPHLLELPLDPFLDDSAVLRSILERSILAQHQPSDALVASSRHRPRTI